MKHALIIGNDRYTDPKLARLKAPSADSQALARVLKDQNIGSFDEVLPLVNKTESQVSRAISTFLTNKKPEDLVLIYFSGHGVLDDRGRLFLALRDTQTSLLKSTAIPSSFIADEMDSCRSKRQILILDCCHSGAFGRGIKAGEQKAITETTFEGSGYGRVVLTAADSTQYALEGDQVIKQTQLSLFTHFLLEGLQTGRADTNNDGYVSLDEWYEFAYTQVLSTTPKQVPHKWAYHQQGDLIIARNQFWKKKAAEIPVDLLRLLESPYSRVRDVAVKELGVLLRSQDPDIGELARAALEQLKEDDSRAVSLAAMKELLGLEQTIKEETIAIEKATREREERETAAKARREKEDREKAEKATREKEEREAAERVGREQVEREATELQARKEAARIANQESIEKSISSEKVETQRKVTETSQPLARPTIHIERKPSKFTFITFATVGGVVITFALGGYALIRSLSALFGLPNATETPMISRTVGAIENPTEAPTQLFFTQSSEPVAMETLIANAQNEGTLNVIALPHDWCNYGAVIQGFKDKYGIEINELDPAAGSGEQLEAIRANQDNPGPQAPDVIDVGLAFGPTAKDEGLIQPYKIATWDEIPEGAKDPDGYWYGDYYGVLSFEVNTTEVAKPPAEYADLLNPEYNGQVALSGNPLTSNAAILSVWAAGLATGATGEEAAQAGLEYFKQLNEAGNFLPIDGDSRTVGIGETPILIDWSYNSIANDVALSGDPDLETVVPAEGRLAGVFVQAISAYAPHPNAAKLWMEYLYSDEGQLGWASGFCHPIRFEAMSAAGTIPEDVLAQLPSTEGAYFPTIEEIEAARTVITEGWPIVVGVEVKPQP